MKSPIPFFLLLLAQGAMAQAITYTLEPEVIPQLHWKEDSLAVEAINKKDSLEAYITGWYELGKKYAKYAYIPDSLHNSYRAIGCFEKVVSLAPDHYKAWTKMGSEYYQMQVFGKIECSDKMLHCYQQANKLKPEDSSSWQSLAAAHEVRAEYVEAIKCYTEFMRIHEKIFRPYYFAYRYRADCYEAQGDVETKAGNKQAAIECYENAIRDIMTLYESDDIDAERKMELTDPIYEKLRSMRVLPSVKFPCLLPLPNQGARLKVDTSASIAGQYKLDYAELDWKKDSLAVEDAFQRDSAVAYIGAWCKVGEKYAGSWIRSDKAEEREHSMMCIEIIRSVDSAAYDGWLLAGAIYLADFNKDGTDESYTKAVEHLERAIQLKPCEYMAWQTLSAVHIRKEEWELVVDCTTRCIEMSTHNFMARWGRMEAYNKLGDMASDAGKKERAIAHYQSSLDDALALQKENPNWNYAMIEPLQNKIYRLRQ